MFLKSTFGFSKRIKLRDVFIPGDSIPEIPDLHVSQLEVTISTFEKVMFHHSSKVTNSQNMFFFWIHFSVDICFSYR